MRRREFVSLLGGAAATWPLAARAQQPKVWRIGMLETISEELNAKNLGAFRQGLRDLGYVEGQNLFLDYRSADGDAMRFPNLVAELVRLNVDLITTKGTPAALAAKNATHTIPVIMSGSGDPVALGLVASLNRPGSNITGLSGFTPELDGKRIELLKEVVPAATVIAAFLNMSNPISPAQLRQMKAAAASLGIRFRLFDVQKIEDIQRAFDAMSRTGEVIIIGLDAVTQAHRKMIVELAAKNRLPAIYTAREFIDAGGLMFYGVNFPDLYRRAATYVDKIFKGAKPADLPVEQPTKFELVINLKTAKALGLDVSPLLLARADAVIE
jgi:putative tryptophan/tyrosine transport system substrate-binding protein